MAVSPLMLPPGAAEDYVRSEAAESRRPDLGVRMSTPPPPPPPMPAGGGGGNTQDNGSGTIALVTGILSFFVCPIILSIVAIVFGKKGMAAAAAGTADNGGQVKAGYIMGIISLILAIIFIVIYIILGVVLVSSGTSTS